MKPVTAMFLVCALLAGGFWLWDRGNYWMPDALEAIDDPFGASSPLDNIEAARWLSERIIRLRVDKRDRQFRRLVANLDLSEKPWDYEVMVDGDFVGRDKGTVVFEAGGTATFRPPVKLGTVTLDEVFHDLGEGLLTLRAGDREIKGRLLGGVGKVTVFTVPLQADGEQVVLLRVDGLP